VLWLRTAIVFSFFTCVARADDWPQWLDPKRDGGTLRLVAADPKAYRELCSATVCGGTFAVPGLSNGRLNVRDDKELICLELAP
jgi:outer membrane protein assembly factor BamB